MVYLLTASGLNTYYADVSQLRIDVTRSIVERWDLSVPAGMRGLDGRQYSWFGIGSSLLAIPFYVAAKAAGASPENAVSVMNQLTGAATVVLLFLFCRTLGYSLRASLSAAFLYGLGTVAWFMSKDAGDHANETFFVLLSVYLLYRYLAGGRTSFLLASSVSLGWAFITRMTSLLIAPSLLVLYIGFHYGKMPRRQVVRSLGRDLLLFSLALLPFLAIDLWYNYYRFGSIFETGYSLMAARTELNFFWGTPLLTGLAGFLVSPGKGFFYYSPVAILFFFSVSCFMRKHRALALTFICINLSYLFFLSKNIYWHGDCTWGPRYLFVLTPFLMIPTAALLDSTSRNEGVRRKIIAAIFAASFMVQVASVSVHPYRYFAHLRIDKKVNFSEAGGEGVWTIIEPPPDMYFKWRMSPIVAQFGLLVDAVGELRTYHYMPPPADAPLVDKVRALPFMHVPDFWWVYKYVVERSCSGFALAFSLLLLASFSLARLMKTVFVTRNGRWPAGKRKEGDIKEISLQDG